MSIDTPDVERPLSMVQAQVGKSFSEPQEAFGELAKACGKLLTLGVYQSAAGYYLGTQYFDNEIGREVPYTRESIEYWSTKCQAEWAMLCGTWTQKRNL